MTDWPEGFTDLADDRDLWRNRARVLGSAVDTLLKLNELRPEMKRVLKIALEKVEYPGYGK